MYVPDNLRVVEVPQKGKSVIAARLIPAGEVVSELFFDSISNARIAQHFSVQVGENVFAYNRLNTIDDFFNHSCDPNMALRLSSHYDFVALREIQPGEEITWNYLTTEYDLAERGEDFRCYCQAERCVGSVRGFRYLTPEQQKELLPLLSPFLRTNAKFP